MVPHQVPVPVSCGSRNLTPIAFTFYRDDWSLVINSLPSASLCECGASRGIFFLSALEALWGHDTPFSPSCYSGTEGRFIFCCCCFFSKTKSHSFQLPTSLSPVFFQISVSVYLISQHSLQIFPWCIYCFSIMKMRINAAVSNPLPPFLLLLFLMEDVVRCRTLKKNYIGHLFIKI